VHLNKSNALNNPMFRLWSQKHITATTLNAETCCAVNNMNQKVTLIEIQAGNCYIKGHMNKSF